MAHSLTVPKHQVMDEGYQPHYMFHTAARVGPRRSGVLYMGSELELATYEFERVYRALAPLNVGHFWHYGTDGQVELRGDPATLAFYKRILPVEAQFAALRAAGGLAGNGAGCHIHIDRSAFTDEQMYRFMRYHWVTGTDQAQMVAGRVTHWAVWYAAPALRGSYHAQHLRVGADPIRALADTRTYQTTTRGAVNTGSCIDEFGTVELRYFRSTLKPLRYLGYFEWIHGLREMCKVAAQTNVDLTPESVRAYFGAHEDKYPNAAGILAGSPDHNTASE